MQLTIDGDFLYLLADAAAEAVSHHNYIYYSVECLVEFSEDIFFPIDSSYLHFVWL